MAGIGAIIFTQSISCVGDGKVDKYFVAYLSSFTWPSWFLCRSICDMSIVNLIEILFIGIGVRTVLSIADSENSGLFKSCYPTVLSCCYNRYFIADCSNSAMLRTSILYLTTLVRMNVIIILSKGIRISY
jgi:hypothetical protein